MPKATETNAVIVWHACVQPAPESLPPPALLPLLLPEASPPLLEGALGMTPGYMHWSHADCSPAAEG